MSAKPAKVISMMGANLRDSMINLMSGLGTGRDKAAQAIFTLVPMTQPQLDMAYRGDWMARKIVDIPAKDATREWRSWQASNEQIEKLEEEEKRLCLQRKVMQTLQKARLYGGSVMMIGIKNDKNPEKELDPERIKQGDLEFLHVMTRYEFTTGDAIGDVLNPLYGEPEYYELVSQEYGTVRIHPSRVIRFVGNALPGNETSEHGWGDSVLQSAYDAISSASQSISAIASLIQEAKIDIVKIPDFMGSVGTTEYRSRLIERFQLANVGKSIINTLILDKEEEWTRIQQTFNGLPELMNLFLLIVSGAADIPVTRMLGQSPAGLNSTGEGDLANYYDNVASEQSNVIEPALSRLDEVLIRSTFGSRPKEIYYEWSPLWQMSETEQADVGLKKAQAFKIDFDTGLFDDVALSKARINQLVEDGTYPGLEQAIEDAQAEMESGENEEQRAEFAARREAKLAAAQAFGQRPPGVEEEPPEGDEEGDA